MPTEKARKWTLPGIPNARSAAVAVVIGVFLGGCSPKRVVTPPPPGADLSGPPAAEREMRPEPGTTLEATPETMTLGVRAAALAEDQLGKPYQWGASGPDRFDCSGLVYFVYGSLGVELPRVTTQQARAGHEVSTRDLQPGDLLFFAISGMRIDHVGLYVGHDRFIHAPGRKSRVRYADLRDGYWRMRLKIVRRIAPSS